MEVNRAMNYEKWTEVSFLWTLNGEGKFNTVMAATVSGYEHYHLFIKDVVCEEVGEYTTSTNGWAEEFIELDFSDVEGVEAESEVKIEMQVYGFLAKGSDTKTELGLAAWTAAASTTTTAALSAQL